MRKWLSVLTDAEALIAALPDSMEKEIALQKMTECAWWYSLAATDTSIMDNATAKRAVRKMRR